MSLRTSFFLLALCAPGALLCAQTSSSMQPATPAPRATPPSQTLRPALDVLRQAMGEMRIDKWKANSDIKKEADSNVSSIQRDLQSTLPPLLATADAAPDSTSKVLPVFRNVDALYDVMLRLVAAGRLAAPNDQMSALDQALAQLSDGRRALGEQLQASADAQDQRVIRLQAALKAVPPPAPPQPAPVCPSTTTKKRTKSTSKSAKPAPSKTTH